MANRSPRKRLLLTIYLVGVAQLAVAGVAIFVVQRLLQSAPWQMEPARQRALLDSYCELYDTPELLGRALSHLHEVDLSFYRDDGTLDVSFGAGGVARIPIGQRAVTPVKVEVDPTTGRLLVLVSLVIPGGTTSGGFAVARICP